MSVCDPIADMLTRVRNALKAGQDTAVVPHSALKSEIARVLKKEGFIADYVAEKQAGHKVLRIQLKYGPDREPVIRGLRRISRPGLRQYVTAKKVPLVVGGMGIAMLSTSKGIMTDREARAQKVGGEVICYVW
jgi:small subunit ribosomal protein S8